MDVQEQPEVVRVVRSVGATAEEVWRAWTEGVDYFLPKPFEPLELLRFLDHLFDGERAAAV